MLSQKMRFKIFEKLSQQTDQTGTVTTPTQPNIPPPPSFVASNTPGWTWIINIYNSQSVNTINTLIGLINIALHYSSNGQFNMQILRNNSFQVDPSGVPSVDTKYLLNIAVLIYKT